jgi:hypothetical protein
MVVTGGIDALLLLGWMFVIRPGWARIPARSNAERLLEAADHL